MELHEDEIEVGLKHELLIRPRKSEMIVIMEDIYDQILQHNTLKDDHIFKHRAQTALKAFTYNYLDLNLKGFFKDLRETLQNLREKCMILKSDKDKVLCL